MNNLCIGEYILSEWELSYGLLSLSLVCPGAIAFVYQLIHSYSDDSFIASFAFVF